MRNTTAALALLLALGPGAASAQDTDTPELPAGCEMRGTNGMVTAVLCPAGLAGEDWKAAGEAACADRRPCGAWIWDDAAAIPATLPDSHDALPVEAITAAVAIWVAEDQSLITLERVTSD